MANLTPAQIDAFLDGVQLARMATTRPDGRPHVVPVWYLWDQGYFYVSVPPHSVKTRNLRANPQMAVTVDISPGGMRYRYVLLEGRVTFIEAPAVVRAMKERIVARYVGLAALQTPTVLAILKRASVIVKLLPDKIISHDALTPKPLPEL